MIAGLDLTASAILEIGVVLLLAAAAGWLARRVGLPAVVGYLVLGLVVSPFTPGFVADRERLHLLADVGVVLLLFEVGIEVDVARLRREHGSVLWAAPLQIVVTTTIAAAVFALLGVAPLGALLVAVGIAMSSSVVVVNITRSSRRTTNAETERGMLGWSVMQDLAGVAIAAVLVGVALNSGESPLVVLAGLVGFAVFAVVVAWALPRVLVAIKNESDHFLIVSVAAGLAVAAAGSVFFGVPTALAAFLAGLAVTESDVAADARRRLLPFRDVFAVLFFVTVGTLIDPVALLAGLPWLALILSLLIVAKAGIIFVLVRYGQLPMRPLQSAVGLSQVGEFTFVLASAAIAAGLISNELYVAILGAVAISIALSTVLVRLIPRPMGELLPATPD
jgi:CPA2 family monovalent cation:H+ antiporter-2